MNERIKLPAQEWLGYDPERGDLHGYTFEQMREFAKLVVLECAKIAVAIQCPIEEGISRQTQGHTWDMACIAAAMKIKEHFGVEP